MVLQYAPPGVPGRNGRVSPRGGLTHPPAVAQCTPWRGPIAQGSKSTPGSRDQHRRQGWSWSTAPVGAKVTCSSVWGRPLAPEKRQNE